MSDNSTDKPEQIVTFAPKGQRPSYGTPVEEAGEAIVAKIQRAAELANETCDRAMEVLRDRCTGTTWEQTMANRYKLTALIHLGELAEVSRQVPALLSAALEQGNLFGAMDLRTRLNVIWLASDEPDKARAEGAGPSKGASEPAARPKVAPKKLAKKV